MQTIRETGLNTPEGTYKMPTYKEAGMRNFMNLVRTMVNDYGVQTKRLYIQSQTYNGRKHSVGPALQV